MSSPPSDPVLSGTRDADSVLRYSREFLMACAKSPLVERPAALPPTHVWFGEVVKEEPEVSNGSRSATSNRSTMPDRIVLGPPKMSFASSSLGGLKRSDDGLSGFKKSLESPREGRGPRGPPSALEQGFGRETIERLSSTKPLPKVTPKDITGLLSGMDRRRVDPSRSTGSRQMLSSSGTGSGSGSGLSSRLGSATRTTGSSFSSSNNNSNNGSISSSSLSSRSQQRSDAPEWMSYNPESESSAAKETDGEPQAFVDDIQAWKARMKEQERREKEKESMAQSGRSDPKLPSRADSSSSWRSSAAAPQTAAATDSNSRTDGAILAALEKPLSKTLLSNDPMQDIDMFFSPGGIDLTKSLDSSTAFEKFLSQHTVAASTSDDQSTPKLARKADGSRFARFFAEDDPEPELTPASADPVRPTINTMPGKQLSLDQLFQSHGPRSASTAPPPLARMPSEAEILQSMNAAKSPVISTPTSSKEQSEDAFGFSKIMAALAKPPSTNQADQPTSSSPLATRTQIQAPTGGENVASAAATKLPEISTAFSDPSIVTAKTVVADQITKSEESSPTVNSTTSSSPAGPTASSVQPATTPAVSTPSTTSASATPASEPPRSASRPVQVAFGGGIPTSVYRQLSGKSDGQKSASPLIRPLSAVNGSSNSTGGSSPSLSSPTVNSPRQMNAQAINSAPPMPQQQLQSSQPMLPPQQQQQQQQQQQPPINRIVPQQIQQQQQGNKNFGPYGPGSGPAMHSPVMDPRMGAMYPNGGPSPMGPHALAMEESGFFNGMPMQRPPQGIPPQFSQQMPPFSQQMHVSGGPGDFMPPQFVGMPPYGGHPMHPNMFPMNPVEMLMHRGPGGSVPPRPMPGMGPGPGPNHFVPNNFGHPMNGMPHPGLPMNPPPFFPPQVSKPMMTREEFERRNRQQ